MTIDITKVRRYIIYDMRNPDHSLVEANWDMYDMHQYLTKKNWKFQIMDTNEDGTISVYVNTNYDWAGEEEVNDN